MKYYHVLYHINQCLRNIRHVLCFLFWKNEISENHLFLFDVILFYGMESFFQCVRLGTLIINRVFKGIHIHILMHACLREWQCCLVRTAMFYIVLLHVYYKKDLFLACGPFSFSSLQLELSCLSSSPIKKGNSVDSYG